MNIYVILSMLVLLNISEAYDKKKSIANGKKTFWPGFPFTRPPIGYFPPAPKTKVEESHYYEDYDLGEDGDMEDMKTDTKPDYRRSNAFQAEVSSAIHDFTFDLYTELVQNKTDNILISPLSVYTALCMLTLGLGGNSKAQSMKILHGDAFGNLHEDMSELSKVIFNKRRPDITLTKANRIFVDRSIKLLKEFKSGMKKQYHVTAKKVNFIRAAELNRRRINQFVMKKTERKIVDLAPRGSVTADTRLFIVNAMYMKAAWKKAFRYTHTGKFFVSPKESMKVTMMQSDSTHCYSEVNNELSANVVRIEMEGGVSMIIIVPNTAGDFSTLEDGRGKQRMRRALELLFDPEYLRYPQLCRITMPKFKIEHKADDLIKALKQMGMTDIFDPENADLSRMTPSNAPLFVSDMRHKATIDVNENGIEASSATSIGITARMMPQFVDVDKPFMFIVRDDLQGATLFTGKVVKPNYS